MTELFILKMLALVGITGCLARIGFILFRVSRNVKEWKQLLLPGLICFQLFLFVFGKISGETTFLAIVVGELLILGFGFFIVFKEIKRSPDVKTAVSGVFNQFCQNRLANG